MELSSLNHREIDHTLACDEQLRRNQQLLQEGLSEENLDLRETRIKSFQEMEELKRFQGSTFDEFSRKVEDRESILEFTAKIQKLQSAVNCMNDSREF